MKNDEVLIFENWLFSKNIFQILLCIFLAKNGADILYIYNNKQRTN